MLATLWESGEKENKRKFAKRLENFPKRKNNREGIQSTQVRGKKVHQKKKKIVCRHLREGTLTGRKILSMRFGCKWGRRSKLGAVHPDSSQKQWQEGKMGGGSFSQPRKYGLGSGQHWPPNASNCQTVTGARELGGRGGGGQKVSPSANEKIQL